MDELHILIATHRDIQDCSILCYSETWLGERTSDKAITLDGYMVLEKTEVQRKSARFMEETRLSLSNNADVPTVRLSQDLVLNMWNI